MYAFCVLIGSFWFVADINKDFLENMGARLRLRREELRFSQRHVADQTGITMNTISAIENGKGGTLNNLLLICRALKIQPRDVMAADLKLTSVFELSPESSRRLAITKQLEELIFHTDFFDQPRRVSEVIENLGLDSSLSNRFSVYLTSYCKEGVLEYVRSGHVKKYRKS